MDYFIEKNNHNYCFIYLKKKKLYTFKKLELEILWISFLLVACQSFIVPQCSNTATGQIDDYYTYLHIPLFSIFTFVIVI